MSHMLLWPSLSTVSRNILELVRETRTRRLIQVLDSMRATGRPFGYLGTPSTGCQDTENQFTTRTGPSSQCDNPEPPLFGAEAHILGEVGNSLLGASLRKHLPASRRQSPPVVVPRFPRNTPSQFALCPLRSSGGLKNRSVPRQHFLLPHQGVQGPTTHPVATWWSSW